MATTQRRARKTTSARARATGANRGKGARGGGRKTSSRRVSAGKRSTASKRSSAGGRATKRSRATTRPRDTERSTQEGLVTTNHGAIRRWVEERGGSPACVRGTGDANDVGLLRIDFPGYTGAEALQPISWDEFFDKFEERKLAFLHRAQSHDGGRSYFNKLIERPKRRSTHGR